MDEQYFDELSKKIIKDFKKRDWWDKAAILSTFLSSVVLAFIGIIVSLSIQKAQIAVSKEQVNLQREISETQFQTQNKLAKVTADAADSSKLLQEGQLTASLIDHLSSQNPTRRRMAVEALKATVPERIFENVLIILAKDDENTEVRAASINQLRNSSNPDVLIALKKLSEEKTIEEKKLASIAISQYKTKAEIERIVKSNPIENKRFDWDSGDPNPDINTFCWAEISSKGFTVNNISNNVFNITRRFFAVSHCTRSKHPAGVPECNSRGNISAAADIEVSEIGRAHV